MIRCVVWIALCAALLHGDQAVGQEKKTQAAFPEIMDQLQLKWPKNRTLRFVFHGHSVPAGYFKTPTIRRFDSYPLLFHRQMCDRFPTAAIDVSVTAIGGENSQLGAARFADDVLSLKPDLIFIDYCLNDRRLSLEQAKQNWEVMIVEAKQNGIPVVLLTPTPDASEDITDKETLLQQHSDQVKQLGQLYSVPVVDSYSEFQKRVVGGEKLWSFLSQGNHPNRKGHEVVTELIMPLFPSTTPPETE